MYLTKKDARALLSEARRHIGDSLFYKMGVKELKTLFSNEQAKFLIPQLTSEELEIIQQKSKQENDL